MTMARLSPLDALIEAGARVGQRRAALSRACGLPLAATVLASGAGSVVVGGAQVLLQLTSVALLGLTGVHVHRVLSFEAPPAELGKVPLRLWLRYLVTLLSLVIGLLLSVTAPVTWVADQAWSGSVPSPETLNVYLASAFAIVAVGIYLSARLCLVLPAVALQHTRTLRLAWQRSRGNAAALAVLLLLPERLHWLISRALGDSAPGRLVSALLEALVLVAIVALLSVAWSRLTESRLTESRLTESRLTESRLTEPVQQRAPSPPSLAAAVPARWATFLLAFPILLSHGWSQAQSHRQLLALRDETALLARSAVASERQHSASRAVIDGDRARGLQLYREALELHRAANNPRGEAEVLVFIASMEREQGNEPAARAAFETALERARASGETGIVQLVQKALAASPVSSP